MIFHIEIRIIELKSDLMANKLKHQQRTKKCHSQVWTKFHEIRTTDTNEKIETFFLCTTCNDVIYNPCIDGYTKRLLRHNCASENGIVCSSGSSSSSSEVSNTKAKIPINQNDKKRLKIASAKFVAKDLRPFYAIECEGLIELCDACMKFGQKNRKATTEDLKYALPSRNGLRTAIAELADDYRAKVAEMIKHAMNNGGVAATTDTWTDDYRHTTYISTVLHTAICTGEDIEFQRFILATKEVPEAVKTGEILLF